jgi:hypothetical protein
VYEASEEAEVTGQYEKGDNSNTGERILYELYVGAAAMPACGKSPKKR